jgi:hypothetical protein
MIEIAILDRDFEADFQALREAADAGVLTARDALDVVAMDLFLLLNIYGAALAELAPSNRERAEMVEHAIADIRQHVMALRSPPREERPH